MVRMFGEKDRARYSKGKRCGRWLGCMERKTEQDIVRARDVVDGYDVWRERPSKSKRCGRWLGCLERKTEQEQEMW